MARLVPEDAPDVVAVFLAKRRLARSLPLTATNVCSALLSASTRSVSALVCSLVQIMGYRPVLRMLTRANLAIGQPWLTELLCDGWPLPSLNAPPS